MVERSGLDQWLGDVVYPTVVVRNWGGVYSWSLPTGWWWVWLVRCCATNTLMGPFHVAFAVAGLGLR